MLERAFLHEFAAGDVFVLVGHAHDEAEVDFRVGVVVRGAEFEHVAQAFLGAVFARDAVVVVGDAGGVSMARWRVRGLRRLTFRCTTA